MLKGSNPGPCGFGDEYAGMPAITMRREPRIFAWASLDPKREGLETRGPIQGIDLR